MAQIVIPAKAGIHRAAAQSIKGELPRSMLTGSKPTDIE